MIGDATTKKAVFLSSFS